jgi:hypothetical protein
LVVLDGGVDGGDSAIYFCIFTKLAIDKKKMLLFLSLKLGDLSVPLIDRHARTNRFGFKFGVFVGFEEENEEGGDGGGGGGGEREVEDEAGGQQVRG